MIEVVTTSTQCHNLEMQLLTQAMGKKLVTKVFLKVVALELYLKEQIRDNHKQRREMC